MMIFADQVQLACIILIKVKSIYVYLEPHSVPDSLFTFTRT